MTRTVKDAAILLGVCTGEDAADPVTAGSKERRPSDYTSFCRTDALKGKRIGVEKSYLEGHESVVALYKQAIEVLKQQGAEVVEVELLKRTRIGNASYEVLLYEFKDGLNKYLAGANGKVKTLADLIEFNKSNEQKAMPWFKQEILEQSAKKGPLTEQAYLDALKKSTGIRDVINKMMKDQKLDAICSTSYGPANLTDLVHGDYEVGFYFSSPAAMAGYPHITVPMGHVHELPVGLSFIAGAWQEDVVIGMAYAYEQASRKRKVPGFVGTIG
jgi:amidase